MSDDRKRVSLRLPDDLYNKASSLAKSQGRTLNDYLSSLIEKDLGVKKQSQSGQENIEESEDSIYIHIPLTREAHEELKAKSDAEGVSIKRFVQNLISRKSYVNLQVAVRDLYDYQEDVEKLVALINSVATVMLRTDKAYKADVERIVDLMGQINETTNRKWRQELEDRRKLYYEARRKVFSDISDNKLKYRRSSNGGNQD